MKLLKYLYSLKKSDAFILITGIYIIIMWLSNILLINETVFYNTYSEQLTYERIIDLFNKLNKIKWAGYLFAFLGLVIKFYLVAFVIYCGIFLCNLHYRISFGEILGIVIVSEIIFLLAGVVKLLWFLFFVGDYNLNDLGFFFPCSLGNLFSSSEVEPFWVPAMQSLNLFQLAYIILLSAGLWIKSNLSRNEAEKVILISYVPGFVVWLAFITFLSAEQTL